MSTVCVPERCDPIRKKYIDAVLRSAYLERDYLDVKLHYEDNLEKFAPTKSELESTLSAWQKAHMDAIDAQQELSECKLKR
jgi:hypothetical protein